MRKNVGKVLSYAVVSCMVLSSIMLPKMNNESTILADTQAVESSAEETFAPPITPPPTPIKSQIPYYDTFFTIQTKATYYAYDTERFSLSGFYLSAINSIHYDGKLLEKDKDYFYDVNCSLGSLYFSDEFLDQLKVGKNTLELYANYNQDCRNGEVDIEITKVLSINPSPSPIIAPSPSPVPSLIASSKPTTVPSPVISSKPVTPSPEPSIIYEVLFQLDDDNLIYSNTKEEQFRIYGRGLFCITGMNYKGEILELNKDYFYDDPYGDSYIYFSDEFLNKMDVGKNTLTMGVYLNPSLGEEKREIKIEKVVMPYDRVDPVVDIKCETSVSGGISQHYTIKCADANKPAELSKVKLRFYYKKDDTKNQVFVCDNAGIQLNQAPYYKDCTDMVVGTFGKDYVDITFDTDTILNQETLNFAVRIYQEDWSSYTNLKAGNVIIVYP